MKKIELKGIIEKDFTGDWLTVKLVQEDGYKIDLVSRFKEAIESFPEMEIQVGYYLSEKVCSRDEILEGFLKYLFGYVDASFESNPYRYSSWTSGVDHDTNLTIGGHNLLTELYAEEGKFIIIELNFKDKNG